MINNPMNVAEVTCPQCGERNRGGQEFCAACKGFLWDHAAPNSREPTQRRTGSSRPTTPDRSSSASATGTTIRTRPAASPPPDAAEDGDHCPSCGRPREAGRRFCGSCGHAFPADRNVVAGHGSRDSVAERRRARTSARAYRRSLPAVYRLRRAAIVIVVAILVSIVAAASWPDPRRWVADRWYDLRGTVVPVKITGVRITPSSLTAADSQPGYLTDGTRSMWTAPWAVGKASGSCHQSSGPMITLSFAPTRVRRIVIFAGAPDDHPERLQQFRPRTISFRYDNQPCRTAQLSADGNQETITADSRSAVTNLSIVITGTYDPPANGRSNTLSITEISLQARP